MIETVFELIIILGRTVRKLKLVAFTTIIARFMWEPLKPGFHLGFDPWSHVLLLFLCVDSLSFISLFLYVVIYCYSIVTCVCLSL